jgi:hypothetical protein|tara:strand:- start:17757 stop:18635 length:879 start_codon:yes stop_codon:yes gene_type:complete
MRDDFAVFILTHGRADNCTTYNCIRDHGYTGRIVLIVDDMDSDVPKYKAKYGDEVVVFDKRDAATRTDACDNLDEMRAVVFARNECYRIAKRLGVRYFLVLDDDYNRFVYRFDENLQYNTMDGKINDFDGMCNIFLKFLETTPTKTITMAQGGDFLGGREGQWAQRLTLTRKAMNSFFCDAERPIDFMGRINEDVNAYCRWATIGDLFFTSNHVSLNQQQTQQNDKGLTDIYLKLGTYVKSFYTVLNHPSGARVAMMNSSAQPRIHHQINWNKTAPKIIREKHRKTDKVVGE